MLDAPPQSNEINHQNTQSNQNTNNNDTNNNNHGLSQLNLPSLNASFPNHSLRKYKTHTHTHKKKQN